MSDGERRFLDNPRTVRWIIRALYSVCLVLVVADFVVHRHVKHPFEALWGFHALYGLVACVLLVLVARGLRRLVMRREDHYDE